MGVSLVELHTMPV